MTLTFLSLTEILKIHQDQIERYGGEPGIRDMGLLKSAAGMPSATFNGEFLHTDIYAMAAAYLFHLVMNHAFIDGNKRVGAVAALVFLSLNGYDFTAPEKDLAETVLAVARGDIEKADVTIFIRRWTSKS